MNKEDSPEADWRKDFQSLQKELEKNKKAIDREIERLNGTIKEMTEDPE